MSSIHDQNVISFHDKLDFSYIFRPPGNINASIWDEIQRYKTEFLESNKDPRLFPYIFPEAAESWIRSKNYNVDPYMPKFTHFLKPTEFEALLKKKKELVETVSDYTKILMPLLIDSKYILSLYDENGVCLLNEGAKNDVELFNALDIHPSSVLSEEYVGTTAHALCIRHRKPIQIIGPYNYCMVLQNNITSSTPIFDENGDVIGALVVVQMLAKKDLQDTNLHSLGWVISMGYAIENSLKLKKQNHYLSVMNGTLETTLLLVDEGIITISNEGLISHINKDAAQILGVPDNEVIGKPYTEFINNEQAELISQVLLNGKPLQDYETAVQNKKSETQILMNIKPILEGQDGNPQGVVVRLGHKEKIDKMVAHRSGSTAIYKFDDIVGESPSIKRSIDIAKQISKLPNNVLLIGESGTGKELFAQAIHNQYRPEGPFVAINCAALPRNLIESELFGYEGGAFTGAERKGRPGKIELANGGTLFLDEIGDMPLELQPVLLRVLEDKRVMRVGGSRHVPVDFRVIAATNKDVYRMVKEKSFREDLYFRLSIFKIKIPALRDRGNDIILLANYFINDVCKKMDLAVPELSPEVCKRLRDYYWPGNVRQLENTMVYAVNMTQNGVIKISDLPDELINMDTARDKYRGPLSLREMEKNAILQAIMYTENNTAEAARILGIGRTTLYRKMKEFDIDIKDTTK